MLFSPDRNENDEKLFPLFTPVEMALQTILLAITTCALTFVIDFALGSTSLSLHVYYTLFIFLGALLIGSIAAPHLARRYALQNGKLFVTREERLREQQKTPALILGVTVSLGWGIAMWIMFCSFTILEYGWHPSVLLEQLLMWLGAGAFMGVITVYQSKW